MGRKRSSPQLAALPRYLYKRRQSYYFRSPLPPRAWIALGPDLHSALLTYASLLKANDDEVDATRRALQKSSLIARPSRATLADAWQRYKTVVIPTKAPRTQLDNHTQIVNLLNVFGAVALDDLTPVDVRTYLDVRGATAPVRANREIALLSHIFNRAREWGLASHPNPASGVRKFRETGRDRYVTDSEYEAVHRAGDQLVRDAMSLALLIGQRPQDVFALTCADVSGEIISVAVRKTGQRVRIQIVGELKELITAMLLRNRRPGVTALLVNQRGEAATRGMFKKRFEKARRDAGVHFQLRDLRAKNATDTNDLAVAQKRLAHTSRAMTEHYVRSRQGELVAPLDRTKSKR